MALTSDRPLATTRFFERHLLRLEKESCWHRVSDARRLRSKLSVLRSSRSCASASAEICACPIRICSQRAESNIQAGSTSHVPSGVWQIKTSSPRLCSRYCTATFCSQSGCHVYAECSRSIRARTCWPQPPALSKRRALCSCRTNIALRRARHRLSLRGSGGATWSY